MSLTKLPKVGESERIHNNFFKIRKDVLKIESQEDYTYYTLETRPIAVGVIATTDEGRYIINREYRHPTEQVLLGAPGGSLDEGEEVLACAKRELLEETGYTAKSFEVIGRSYPYPSVSSQQIVFVRAKGATKTAEPSLDHAEFIEPVLFSPKELHEALKTHPLDGILLTALYFSSLLTL